MGESTSEAPLSAVPALGGRGGVGGLLGSAESVGLTNLESECSKSGK